MAKNSPRPWALCPPGMDGPEEGEPLSECWSCESEYQYDSEVEDDGMCQNCHEKNGEVFCGFCNQWATGVESPDETTACDKCANELNGGMV